MDENVGLIARNDQGPKFPWTDVRRDPSSAFSRDRSEMTERARFSRRVSTSRNDVSFRTLTGVKLLNLAREKRSKNFL
jgi:hypothetical protein